MCSGKLSFNENNVLESFQEKESLQVCFLVFLWNDHNASWVFMIFYYSLTQNKLLRQKSAILILELKLKIDCDFPKMQEDVWNRAESVNSVSHVPGWNANSQISLHLTLQ